MKKLLLPLLLSFLSTQSLAITNVTVVDTSTKYIVTSTGIGSEIDQIVVDASKLIGSTKETKLILIECYYQIEGTGVLEISADSEYPNTLSLTGKGKYGLRPSQLKFGNDKKFKLTTDSNVTSYLLVTEFRRN
jgi:hypothetical protein